MTFEQYARGLAAHYPLPVVEFFIDLFRFLLDGHNANITGDVELVLGRRARDFRDFVQTAAEVLR